MKEPTVIYALVNSIDMSYEIIYMLCSNPLFSQQLLAYLRNEHDFVYKHLKLIPLMSEQQDQDNLKPCIYSQNCWIMNLVCIELQNLTANKLKLNLKKLVQLLIENTELNKKAPEPGFNKTTFQTLNNSTNIMNNSNFLMDSQMNESKFFFNTSLNDRTIESAGGHCNYSNKIFEILTGSSLMQEAPEPLSLNYFDQQLIEKVIDTCRVSPEEQLLLLNLKLFDLKRVKGILINEIGETNVGSSKINLILELKYILKNVYERNQFQMEFYYKKKFLDSFKTLIETVVLLTPVDIFSLSLRYTFLVALIDKLFAKIQHDNVFPELTYPVASIMFTLVKNLRDVIEQMTRLQAANETLKLLQKQQFFSICEIFSKLLEYLLSSSLTSFNVRTFLYATLLNFFMIFDIKLEDAANKKIASMCNEFEEEYIYKKLNKSYAALFKIICSDSCEGLLNLSTMMGFSILNKMIEFDYECKWLRYIDTNGYLACICNTISSTDNQLLEELFHSELKSDKIIYVFESKLALLMTISKSPEGASLLLKNDLINKFLACSVFAHRKKFERNIYQSQYSSYAIQLLHQYYKLFFPTLKLFISILNTLGQDNIKAKSEVSKFVLKFNDSFVHILTSRQMDLRMLDELKLVTCLLSKIAPFDELLFDQTDSYQAIEYNSALTRIKKEYVNLISLYFVPDQLKLIRRDIEKTHSGQENVGKLVASDLISIELNLGTFLTSLLRSADLTWSTIIFDSTIEYYDSSSSNYNINSKNINIGLLIHFLKYTIENVEKNRDLDLDLAGKQSNLGELVELEKKQLVSTNYKCFEKLSDTEKNIYLRNVLRAKLKANKDDFRNYKSLIEKTLLLVWRHVEFYFVCFTSSNGAGAAGDKAKNQITYEEFHKFRQNLNLALSPSLLKRLVDLENKSANGVLPASSANNFVNILVKRIQRLLHLNSN